MSGPAFERGVHAQIAQLARDIHPSRRLTLTGDELLLEVTQAAVHVLPGVDHAGVSLLESKPRKLRSTAATGPIPRILDKLQEKCREGPCLESAWERHTVSVDDFDSEERWPDFVAAMRVETPVRSSLSIRLCTNDSEMGALNLYSERPGTFTGEVEELALALAAHTAVGLSAARQSDQFKTALASRDIIGQAKGVIMERFDIDAAAAFSLLVRLSQETNTALNEIARQLVERGRNSP